MGTIGHGYGSEWHLLRYLGYHRDALQSAILNVTGGEQIKWLDFEFNAVNQPLHFDREWQGMDFIENSGIKEKWALFWPQSGSAHNWDAVGRLTHQDREEWLLVEAKSHIEEIQSRCAAKSPQSIGMIKKALAAAQKASGSSVPVENWLSPYYQYCNRLAALHFLTNTCKVPARLLFIYFCGDKNGSFVCPQSAAEWEPPLREMSQMIGLDKNTALMQRVHSLFLPVKT